MTAWLIPTGEPRHLASRSHADVTRQSWLGLDGWYDYTYSPFVTYGHTHAGFKRRDYPAHRKNGERMKYYISMTVESENIQQAWHRIYPAIDNHGEGSPSGISEISITEATGVKKRTIIGLAVIAAAVATMFAAPTVASAHDKPQYTTVLWHIPDDSKGPNDQDQPYVISIPGADIQGIKQYAECGKRYQIDVYRPLPSGTKPDTLWANGFLRPNHDGGFLAYDLPYTPYEVFTTKPCPVVTPPVVTPEPSPPAVTPAPVPPVTTPEVPSSPVTLPQNVGPTAVVPPISAETPAPSPSGGSENVAPSQRTAQTCQQAGSNVKTTDRNLDADGDGIGCETRGVAPVPTPIRTEAKFTG